MNFQYGYVFYRDPIDSKGDIHQVINLTDNVNSLPEKIKEIKPMGGGDLPEDWVGAYKKANEEISWRNGKKVIIHLADAGAHGKEFTRFDKYKDEGEKLMYELDRCFENKITIFGYVIREDARNSFNECQKIYRKKGGEYEICDFIQQENYLHFKEDYDDYDDYDVYNLKESDDELEGGEFILERGRSRDRDRYSDRNLGKRKMGRKERKGYLHKEKRDLNKQKEINYGFKKSFNFSEICN